MINEVFVIDIDKHVQILAIDFGCHEIVFSFFFFFAKPSRLVN